MSKRKLPLAMLVLAFIFVSITKESFASMQLSPFTNEVIVTNQQSINGQLTLHNDENKDITITPVVFLYDPQNQRMIDTITNIFVQTKQKTYTVPSGETTQIDYTITPSKDLPDGTYFNLIVLKTTLDDNSSSTESKVGLTANMSHLVVMHKITDEQKSVQYNTQVEIPNHGIPFLKPIKVTYTIQNTSGYVLKPSGEIQIFNNKSHQQPIYLKINEQEEKVYPGGKLQQEFTVSQWSIQDIFFPRQINAYFYNGIDQNYNLVSIQEKVNPVIQIILILIPVFIISFIIILIKDLQKGKKQKS
ncbi:MAG TPA: hypothetical protein PLD77_00125 [Candidatus Dojkabacteria bacterium]|nr:hypothetical protein [Candidatus Dojkabacteria bacterium]